ncbi:MAG: DUF1461 domain-containing protein [Anaerolineae bacterium]|nr:DUF1461 domain-containing protein [Anaerolineae bacterium]
MKPKKMPLAAPFTAPFCRRLMRHLMALFTAVCLAATAVWSVITPDFLADQYTRLPPDPGGLTQVERLERAQTAVTYLRLWAPPETAVALLAEQTWPDGTLLYTPSELAHLVDVKRLTDGMRLACLASLILLFACVLGWMPSDGRFYVLRPVAIGSFYLIPLTFLLLFLASIFWPLFFVTFHRLLFAEGSWVFADTAGLIRLFPELFWFRVGQAILTRMLALGLMTGLFNTAICHVYLKRNGSIQDNK